MSQSKNNIVRWAPRVFTIFLALFLMLFSLDVFDGQSSAGEMALGFMIHNIPSMILLLILWVAWNREWVGAVIFPLLGLAYFLYVPHAHWTVYLSISLPLVVNGLLFLLAWNSRKGGSRPVTQS
jgi:hypothetical protein